MTRPLDRNARLPELGRVDREAGEFWVENPFDITSGGYNLSAFERNRLYLNLGGLSFLDASFASGADVDADSRSVIAADFNRDGAPDLLVGSVGGGALRLFYNRFPSARRVRVDLVGTRSNRTAIGTRVIAELDDGRRLVRDVFQPNGGFSPGPAELILGLGPARRIEKLHVRWPSGTTQQFGPLEANLDVTVTEGDSELRTGSKQH